MVRLQLDSIAQEAMDLNLAKEGYTAFYVDGTNGLDTYPGDSWEQPFKTIQHAVDTADSWAKIFIKAGTYAENVSITAGKEGITLIGEKIDTVIVQPVSGSGILILSDKCRTENLTAIASGTSSVGIQINSSDYVTVKNCIVDSSGAGSFGAGINVGNYAVFDGVKTKSGTSAIFGIGISNSNRCIIKNCLVDGAGASGISLTGTNTEIEIHNNIVQNNTTSGTTLAAGTSNSSIYHNNIINNPTQVSDSGANNEFFENYYDDHTTDTNNDGLCDTPYTFTTGTDHQPVSRRNGWKRESLGYDSATTNTLVFKGTVTTATDATHFASTDLIGHGNDALKDWYIYVFYDTAGTDAAPQGEQQPISDYVSSTGTFTHTAFTADLAVGDEVLIMHPYEATGGDATEAKQDTIITEVGKVPKSDGTSSWNATALAAIQGEAEDALEGENLDHIAAVTTVAADMTAEVVDGSVISRMLSKTSDTSTYNPTTDAQEMLSDKFGGFSGDGGAAQDDSTKASLDLAHTDLDTIIASTQIRRVASGSKTINSAVTKYLSIDSGTNGAEIIGIVIKGVVGADWTLDVYVPTADAVAAPAAGDKRDTNAYVNTDTEGGMLEGFAIPYNCFLDFTNDSAGADNIDDVVIIYRSAAVLTLTWEA